MKKTWKRLSTGFLALATVVTALPTTPVHAESKHCANLTVMNDGEHWFHTDEQIFFRDNWLRKVIQ